MHGRAEAPSNPNPEAYWRGIEDYLTMDGKTPADHARTVYRRMDIVLSELPRRHFAKNGTLGPGVLAVHSAMGDILSQPGHDDELIRNAFPVWRAEVDGAISTLEG